MTANSKFSTSVARSVLETLKSRFDPVVRHPLVVPFPHSLSRLSTRGQKHEKCYWKVHGDIWRGGYCDSAV